MLGCDVCCAFDDLWLPGNPEKGGGCNGLKPCTGYISTGTEGFASLGWLSLNGGRGAMS